MTDEDYIKLNGRGRVILDLVFWQKRSFGDSPKFQGVLVGTDQGSAIIKTRRGTRRFDLVSGYEYGSQARGGGGMRIVDLEQSKAQPVDAA